MIGSTTHGRHSRWLDRAVRAASNSEHPEWRLGACVVKSNRVLGVGWNRDQNDPFYLELADIRKGKASTHAEVAAIRNSGDTQGATLYVARIDRSGSLRCSRPCENCLGRIIDAGIKAIWWTDYHGTVGSIKL